MHTRTYTHAHTHTYVHVCYTYSERNSVIIMWSNLPVKNVSAFFERWSKKTILPNNFYCSKFYQYFLIEILIKVCQKHKYINFCSLQFIAMYIVIFNVIF